MNDGSTKIREGLKVKQGSYFNDTVRIIVTVAVSLAADYRFSNVQNVYQFNIVLEWIGYKIILGNEFINIDFRTTVLSWLSEQLR